ncbi:MAG: hypothetical protein M3Y56_06395 [Armatimonadota bacterium]|nr:hypothetical protein [Armatimonadota bacterium]
MKVKWRMPDTTLSSQLRADDILYRKINPDHWDQQTDKVFPDAFRDKYEAQSFYGLVK